MKINIKSKQSIITEDNITLIKNLGHNSNYYIIAKNTLKILKTGQVLRLQSKDCELVTDNIEDIILYYPEALSAFQSRYIKSQPRTEETSEL